MLIAGNSSYCITRVPDQELSTVCGGLTNAMVFAAEVGLRLGLTGPVELVVWHHPCRSGRPAKHDLEDFAVRAVGYCPGVQQQCSQRLGRVPFTEILACVGKVNLVVLRSEKRVVCWIACGEDVVSFSV